MTKNTIKFLILLLILIISILIFFFIDKNGYENNIILDTINKNDIIEPGL